MDTPELIDPTTPDTQAVPKRHLEIGLVAVNASYAPAPVIAIS